MLNATNLHVAAFVAASLLMLGAISQRTTVPVEALPAIQTTQAAEVQRCAECHAEICDSYLATPHLRTLRKPTDEEVFRHFAGQDVTSRGNAFAFATRDDGYALTAADRSDEKKVDWMFGSGEHAMTGVSLEVSPCGVTEIQQLNVSWFPHCNLEATPGSDHAPGKPSLGVHLNPADSLKCFECHSSQMAIDDGAIDFASLVPGISCNRCHLDAQQHAASGGSLPSGVAWDKLSALESIQRCGECHRRADEFTDDELTPDNKLLIRFAPVGLSQSPCFKAQLDDPDARRLDCVTCHDPHSPAQTDTAFYTAKCNDCHGASSGGLPCPDSPRSENCMPCHMPVVQHEQLRVTDHWIRIRDDI
ncbi:multiheme c-type cytochrome [Rosistilla oblonga]|uniref:multiheme c-type cytochrome n=1 Tax=Rosistilla oblonga TaxID=2527990 RepID=UPI003A986B48